MLMPRVFCLGRPPCPCVEEFGIDSHAESSECAAYREEVENEGNWRDGEESLPGNRCERTNGTGRPAPRKSG